VANVLVYSDGSLGNRIRGIVNAFALSNHPLHIFWPINNWCGSEFQSLFDLPVFVNGCTYTSLQEFESYISHLKGSKALVSHSNHIKSQLFDVILDASRTFFPSSRVRELLNTYDYIIIYTVEVHPSVSIHRYSKILGSLKPIHEIQKKADEALLKANSHSFLSFHARLTDSKIPFSWYKTKLKSVNKQRLVFISSDDESAENHLTTIHPNSFTFPKAAYPAPLFKKKTWNDLVIDTDGRLQPYNKNISHQSTIEAWVDLLILSHGVPIFTNKGSFLELAIVRSLVHTPLSRSYLLVLMYRLMRWIKIAFLLSSERFGRVASIS